MPDLKELTVDDFSSCKDETFRCTAGEGRSFEMTLDEAAEIRTAQKPKEGQRKTFSVVFRGPRDQPLEQGLVHVEHGRVGAHDLFLVPVAEDDEGRYYEAVFT